MVSFQLIFWGGISRLVFNHLNFNGTHFVYWLTCPKGISLYSYTHTHAEWPLLHSNCNLLNFFHCFFLLTSTHWNPPPTHCVFLLVSPLDTDDSGLVDVYDNQRHVWVPGIQPWTPVTQFLRMLVGPCMLRYSLLFSSFLHKCIVLQTHVY